MVGGQEFYPLDSWNKIKESFLQREGLHPFPLEAPVAPKDLAEICQVVNVILLSASSAVQKESPWISVKETISPQHRVEVTLTPTGMERGVTLQLNMGAEELGLESRLRGRSVQSVPFKTSFIVSKVNSKHPLFGYSGQSLSCSVAINNVFKPPFKLMGLSSCDSIIMLQRELLELLRSIPFDLASAFREHLQHQKCEVELALPVLESIAVFLKQHALTPAGFRESLKACLLELGRRFDLEMELSFTESIFSEYHGQRNSFHPTAFQAQIAACFENRITEILGEVIVQLTRQQKDIRLRLTNYAGLENERLRLVALTQEFEKKRRSNASEELLSKQRQGVLKVRRRIEKKIRQFESSKGIILVQELYLSSLEKNPKLSSPLAAHRKQLDELKQSLQANHISVSRDIEALTHSLGVRASHLLVQHAIYSEVEPDLSKVVSVDALHKYNPEVIGPLLKLLPTVEERLRGQDIDSNELLRVILDSELSEREKNAFYRFCDENPEPKSNEVQRFSEQTQQFLTFSGGERGVDGVVDYLQMEIGCLQVVLRFAGEQGKLNTDFKNHLKYYDQVFLSPYLNLIENMGLDAYAEINRAYRKMGNTMKVQMNLSYSGIEEKALLSMFRHINGQLQHKNLFSASVFTRQVKQFMNHLSLFKNKISKSLMKRILETYTVYMMGSSRTKNLSRERVGVAPSTLSFIRESHSSLTNEDEA
jgi:hypothetical protein